MAPKRSRTVDAGSSSSSPHPLLVFTNPDQQVTFRALSSLSIEPNRYIDFDALEVIGIADEVRDLIENVGWGRFVDIREDVHYELLLEFLCTLDFQKEYISVLRPGVINFKLGGRRHQMSVAEFGVALGVYSEPYIRSTAYTNALVDFPSDEMPALFWESITVTGPGYSPATAKSTFIRIPSLRYLHKFIAHSISGR